MINETVVKSDRLVVIMLEKLSRGPRGRQQPYTVRGCLQATVLVIDSSRTPLVAVFW